ncbi:MAG TPA: relaxase MobL [Candidatus Udaeobacter sp.]|nr:relaxase MobL [Candidatus Udaeobacter sp.]
MTGERCILSVKYVPAGSAKRLGGFLRYVQFRDQHPDAVDRKKLDGLTRYIAHRDRTAPGGRLFGPHGNCGDLDRRALLAHVSRSMRQSGGRHPRAAYRMVLSPERAEGLDLKALTRAAMEQLSRDAGGSPPWIAAIHRNTKHPHVHIVMAARREVEPGRFRTVVINRERLAGMKLALGQELVRERGGIAQKVAFREFAPDVGRLRPRLRHPSLDVMGGAGRIVDRTIRAFGRLLHDDLQRLLAEEERREREEHKRRGHSRELQLER